MAGEIHCIVVRFKAITTDTVLGVKREASKDT